jgi:hypothetical protein
LAFLGSVVIGSVSWFCADNDRTFYEELDEGYGIKVMQGVRELYVGSYLHLGTFSVHSYHRGVHGRSGVVTGAVLDPKELSPRWPSELYFSMVI